MCNSISIQGWLYDPRLPFVQKGVGVCRRELCCAGWVVALRSVQEEVMLCRVAVLRSVQVGWVVGVRQMTCVSDGCR